MQKRSVSHRPVFDSGLRSVSQREPSGLAAIDHYLELADIALGVKKPDPHRPRRPNAFKPPIKQAA